MDEILQTIIDFYNNNVTLITTIIIIVILTCLLLLLLTIIFNRNLFIPTVEEKINSRLQNEYFKKDLIRRYEQLVNIIIRFRKKHGLFFAPKYTVEDMNNVFERTFQKLTKNQINYLTYYEFASSNIIFSTIAIVIFLPFLIFTGSFRAVFLTILLLILIFINFIRYLMLKMAVQQQNAILEANFGDFYLSQHHILLVEHKNPFSKGLEIYQYKTNDPFMKQWVTNTLSLIKRTSENQVIERYQALYKDVYVLCQLLSIEQQLIFGADCYQQLKNLRDSIIQQKQFKIEENSRKIVNRAMLIRNIIVFILLQVGAGAIVAFFIYSRGF